MSAEYLAALTLFREAHERYQAVLVKEIERSQAQLHPTEEER